MIDANFRELVLAIPNNDDGDGFYNPETGEKFIEYAETLTNLGLSEEDAIEFLTDIYNTVANEYGD